MPFALWVILRLAAVAFWVLTATYGIVCYSPFAFEMFIRPQLLPSVNEFVAWHHAWHAGAYIAAVASLWPELARRGPHSGRSLSHWAAVLYAVVFGLIAARLVVSPYLPLLTNDWRSLAAALAALVPLAWLALIDHLSLRAGGGLPELAGNRPTGQYRLFVVCTAAASYVWVAHVSRALLTGSSGGSALAWAFTIAWALTLTVTTFAVAFAVLAFIGAVASWTSRPAALEYALTVLAGAAATSEFIRRVILPTIALGSGPATVFAAGTGVTLVALWSGIALRRAESRAGAVGSPLDVLMRWTSRRSLAAAGLVALAFASAAALTAVERLDWEFVVQRSIVVAEAIAASGLLLGLTSGLRQRAPRALPILMSAAGSLALLTGLPRVAPLVAAWSGDPSLARPVTLQRYAAAEVSFALMSGALVEWPGRDPGYYRFLQMNGSPYATPRIPTVELAASLARTETRRPDIFLFVIDSLRSDYLSPYNPAVTFTPRIDEFARESYVFSNAFTRHTGTELAAPSIWAGAVVVHRVRAPGFERMNAIEKLLNMDGYRLAINDFTVRERLRPTTPTQFLDPGVPSADTDLCSNLDSLSAYLDATAGDPRPVFGYLSPMNVHIMNTRRPASPSPSGETYPGFFDPYARSLRRIDGCLGRFLGYLRSHGRWDDSVVILTSDHGDTLGEDGFWGHAFWLFPEDAKIPLIIHLPDRWAPYLTTDLARIAFSTDIAPTLYTLLGHEIRDLGPLFGAPLFVAPDRSLVDRRRDSFLVTSSYAATYGLLRRNGRFLYVSDLFDRKEFAFDMAGGQIRKEIPIDRDLQLVNQRLIRSRLAEAARFYGVTDSRTR
jgi:hypothetical protein